MFAVFHFAEAWERAHGANFLKLESLRGVIFSLTRASGGFIWTGDISLAQSYP